MVGICEPVATLADAMRWLLTFSKIEDWLFEPDAELPPEAKLVCYMFRMKPEHVIRDLRKAWNEARAVDRPAPLRRLYPHGWR